VIFFEQTKMRYILTPKEDHFSTSSAKKTSKVYNTRKV